MNVQVTDFGVWGSILGNAAKKFLGRPLTDKCSSAKDLILTSERLIVPWRGQKI